ncbi:uncharacterized protein PAC_04587 [Phialocephala subalpina]|uniref:Uncharacterized protein n=1 Tax=Phialocephala subalpina TaxID=576137 RepID=A0A1L7WPJ3_9HELO|nr:uncharacterized protein PAC_04587 [Phialocephala subalpina]
MASVAMALPTPDTQLVTITIPRVEDYPIIESSTLNGSLHRRTSFKLCTLRYVEIHCSTISECELDNCKLFNCTVQKSTLAASSLHECRTSSSSMEKCQMTSSPLAFRRFPPELREMIFQGRITNITNNRRRMPKILIALRCDPEMYQETLRCYYKLNSFTVLKSNLPKCLQVSSKALANIEKLKIKSLPLAPSDFPESFWRCPRVREFSIEPMSVNELFSWTRFVLLRLHNISKLRVAIATTPGRSQRKRQCHRGLLLSLQRLDKHLECAGKLERVSTGKFQYWIWKAPEGERLRWRGSSLEMLSG